MLAWASVEMRPYMLSYSASFQRRKALGGVPGVSGASGGAGGAAATASDGEQGEQGQEDCGAGHTCHYIILAKRPGGETF
jgi:hypothetical protein